MRDSTRALEFDKSRDKPDVVGGFRQSTSLRSHSQPRSASPASAPSAPHFGARSKSTIDIWEQTKRLQLRVAPASFTNLPPYRPAEGSSGPHGQTRSSSAVRRQSGSRKLVSRGRTTLEDGPFFIMVAKFVGRVPLPLFFVAGLLIGIFASSAVVAVTRPKRTAGLTDVRRPAIGVVRGARSLFVWRPMVAAERAIPRAPAPPVPTTREPARGGDEAVPCLPAPCSLSSR
jgi:hypothetical protein